MRLSLVHLVTILMSAIGFASNSALADPIAVTDAFYFREFRSANDTGGINNIGDRLVYGANSVVPNGDAGTTATRAFGANAPVSLQFNPRSVNPNQFSASINYTLTRALLPANLVFMNGADTTSVTVAPVGNIGRMPFARALSMNGTGTALTLNWTDPTPSVIPPGVTIERTQVRVFDLQHFNSAGNADVIHTASLSSPTGTSYTLPATFNSGLSLQLGHSYAVGIRLEDLRDGVTDGAAALLSSSEAYFNFTPTNATLPPNLYLPQHELGSRFVFDIPVEAGHVIFVDPTIAVGYDYQIGVGNPNFLSVTLPTGIGDNLYDLFLFNTVLGDWVNSGVLAGGVTHDFGLGGVDRFRILGIETSAGLDPNDTTAFATGLTFTAAGDFTGTMTPLTVAVPEPETYAMLLAGLGLLGWVGRRRKQVAAA